MIVFISIKWFYLSQLRITQRAVVERKHEVLDATPDLEKLGIRPGISVRLARRRCPGLQILEYRAETYFDAFNRIWSVFAEHTPNVETQSFHLAYLDVAQDTHRFGGVEQMLSSICRQVERKEAVKVEWGGGVDKWLAWLSRGQNQVITPEMEELVLSKLPIETLALPEHVADRLHRFDIHTIAQLLNLPAGFLEYHLGFERDFVRRRLSRQKDPVRANFPPPLITAVKDVDHFDEMALERALGELSANLAAKLSEARMASRSLSLSFQFGKDRIDVEHKLANTHLSPSRIERILCSHLPPKRQSSLKRIVIQAQGLIPAVLIQDTLWGEQGKVSASEAIDSAFSRIQSRYGSSMLMTGSDSFARQKPRFAQLVYRSRGLTLT